MSHSLEVFFLKFSFYVRQKKKGIRMFDKVLSWDLKGGSSSSSNNREREGARFENTLESCDIRRIDVRENKLRGENQPSV